MWERLVVVIALPQNVGERLVALEAGVPRLHPEKRAPRPGRRARRIEVFAAADRSADEPGQHYVVVFAPQPHLVQRRREGVSRAERRQIAADLDGEVVVHVPARVGLHRAAQVELVVPAFQVQAFPVVVPPVEGVAGVEIEEAQARTGVERVRAFVERKPRPQPQVVAPERTRTVDAVIVEKQVKAVPPAVVEIDRLRGGQVFVQLAPDALFDLPLLIQEGVGLSPALPQHRQGRRKQATRHKSQLSLGQHW